MNHKDSSFNSFSDKKIENSTKLHQEKLGYELPDNYFANSKAEILQSVIAEEKVKKSIFRLNTLYAYPIAASIILLIGFTVWMNLHTPNTIVNTNTSIVEATDVQVPEDEMLIQSLLVEDEQLDDFVDEYIVTQAIAENNKNEEQIENLLINSLLINDTLLDNYMEDNLTDVLIL